MRNKPVVFALVTLFGVWLGAGVVVCAVENHPGLENALGYLKTASEATLPRSPKDPPPKLDQAALIETLQSAKKALKNAPNQYKGLRAKAVEFVDAAITEVKDGDKNQKAHGYIRQAISEINQAKAKAKVK
jgi:hypothetical protein